MAEEAEGGALRELLAVFGFGVDTDGLKKGETEIGGFIDRVKGLAAGVAGLFVAHEIEAFAESGVRAMRDVEHAADRLGITTERVQQLDYAAESLGMESGALTNAMSRLQVTQQAAATGSAQAGSAFSKMGVSVKDSTGKMKDADVLFLDAADGISKQKDASLQAALATQLFGRSGRELLPFLKQGREGLEDLVQEFQELGGGYSEKAIEQSKKYEAQSAALNLSLKSLKGTILEALLPVLTDIVRRGSAVVIWFRELVKQSNVVQATMIVLGGAAVLFGLKLAAAFSPVLLVAAAIGGLILIVDDFLTMMEGGKSLIGDTIDKIFGKDAHLEVVKDLRDAWAEVRDAIKTSYDYAKEFFDLLGEAGGAIGDNLAQGVNKVKEATGDYEHGRGGLTQIENTAGLDVQRYLEARNKGQDVSKFRLTRIKGESEEVARKAFDWLLSRVERGEFPMFQPKTKAPEKPLAPAVLPFQSIHAGGGPSTVSHFFPTARLPPPATTTIIESPINIDLDINAAPSHDEKAVGEHAAKRVGEVVKQERRAAAATLQRPQSVASKTME